MNKRKGQAARRTLAMLTAAATLLGSWLYAAGEAGALTPAKLCTEVLRIQLASWDAPIRGAQPDLATALVLHNSTLLRSNPPAAGQTAAAEEESETQEGTVLGSDGGGLPHEHWQENLKLALLVQQHLTEQYPTLMRPMYLRASRYNEHATTGSLLVEVGAAGNSLDEALFSARLFADGFADVIQTPA